MIFGWTVPLIQDNDSFSPEILLNVHVFYHFVLQGEAVRLTRQLPLNLSRADVTNTLARMKDELNTKSQVCLHGRPFYHDLLTVPETEVDALEIMSSSH